MTQSNLFIFSILIFSSLLFGNLLEINSGGFRAKIERDEWGVPHIYGERDGDVSFGLAYAHAQDDFNTIQDILLETLYH